MGLSPLNSAGWRSSLAKAGGYAVPFLLIAWFAIESGGYGQIIRSQVGILVWWAVLLGVLTGLLPLVRVTGAGWVMIGLLAALALLTALAAGLWTQSTERSVIELARILTLLGCLLLMVLLQGRDGLRRTVAAVGLAVSLIAIVAIAARYHPSWFTPGELPEGYPRARLNYPLGYWNGLGAFMAMGLPVLLTFAVEARSALARALATAILPVLGLVIYLTASRGGAIAALFATLVLVLFFPRRLALLAPGLLSLAGTLTLIIAISRYPALPDNLGASGSDGAAMTGVTLAVIAITAGIAWLLDTRVIGRVFSLPDIRPATTVRLGIGLGAVLAAAAFVALVSGFAGDRLDEFRQPVVQDSTVGRLSSLQSGERYEQWVAAIDAGMSRPLTGIGPGAYEYWWSREATGTGFVRDAHSFYLEGFAELGILGFLLAIAVIVVPIVIAMAHCGRRRQDGGRPLLAGTAAGMCAFAVAAGIDWAWELTVLPVTFLALAAAAVGPEVAFGRGRRHSPGFRLPFLARERWTVAIASVVAIVIIAVPMAGATYVEKSQSAYRAGDLPGAVQKAQDAARLTPWSATALIQLAQVEYEAGNRSAAVDAARRAVKRDPYRWTAWYVLGTISPPDAERAARKIQELNPEPEAAK